MTIDEIEPGQSVLYVPHHAHGDQRHADCEPGIVSSKNHKYAFVLYVRKRHTEATDPAQLVLLNPAPPEWKRAAT